LKELQTSLKEPVEQATKISFKRIKDFIKNSYWLERAVEESRASYVSFLGGGSIMALSASDQSHIEGHTFDVIIVEESQDISNYVYYETIVPMGAFTDASIVKIGVPKKRGHFYDSIHKGQFYVVKSTWKDCPREEYKTYVKRKRKELTPEAFASQFELKWNTRQGTLFEPEWLEKAKQLGIDYDLHLIDKQIDKWDYAIGVDPAKQVDPSATVVWAHIPEYGISYPCHLMEMIGRDWPGQAGAIKSLVHRQFPKAKRKVYVDTQATDAIVDIMAMEDQLKLKAHRVTFSVQSKEERYDFLIKNLVQGKIALPVDRTREVLALIEQFFDLEVKYTAKGHKSISHPSGKHDDWTDACVLGYEGLLKGKNKIMFADEGVLSTEGAYKKSVEKYKKELEESKEKPLDFFFSAKSNASRTSCSTDAAVSGSNFWSF